MTETLTETLTVPVDTPTATPMETTVTTVTTQMMATVSEEPAGAQGPALHSVPDTTELFLESVTRPIQASRLAGVDTSTSDGAGVEPVDVREQARTAWRDSEAAGQSLTGRELGDLFGRSERWGRDRVAEARPAGTDNGRGKKAARRRAVAGKTNSANGGTDTGSETAVPAARQAATARGDENQDGHRAVAATGPPVAPAQAHAPSDAPPDSGVPAGLPAGARLVAWAGFLFGTVISVAANVLHAWLPTLAGEAGVPGLAPQIGAAVWPIALVISVEVLSRIPWPAGWAWNLARYGGAGVVAVGAAVISYGHLHGVLAAWDYGTTGAAVGPLVIDGLMTISGFALLAMSDHGKAASR